MTQKNALMALRSETSIHAGAGSSDGVVDLPIQREGHSGWPCIFGSSLKGALRAAAEADETFEPERVVRVFGPSQDDDPSLHAGALAVGDARLLALPVRSMTGHFRWVTCPALLRRLARDARRLGLELDGLEVEVGSVDEVLVVATDAQALYLEEYRFETRTDDSLKTVVAAVSSLFGADGMAQELEAQLAVVHDEIFAHLAQHATPVAPHIRIDNETRTVAKGALWYEETLPPESLLYAPLTAQASREKGSSMDAGAVLRSISRELLGTRHPYLQVGGNETVGMGWCRACFTEQEA